MTSTFQDVGGNSSSKRVMGTSLVGAGGILLVVTGVIAIFKEVADPDTAIACGKWLVICGSGLLGVTVLEKIRGKK